MTAPPVSLILIAYRQEKFVEAAVASALAQDYPNLEIVLSDDCSPDATFAIMERLAADYRGPHRLVLNRTGGGGGTLAHVLHATARSTGSLIVVSAGDDISYPHRVRRLADEWQRTGAHALFSAFHRIDDQGRRLEGGAALPRADYDPARFFDHGRARQIAGASAAYDRRLLEAVRAPAAPVFAEDYFLSLLLGWRSCRVAVIPEPLLAYRVHGGALTSAGENMLGLEGFERKSAQSAAMTRDVLQIFGEMVQTGNGVDPAYGTAAHVHFDRVRSEIAFLDYRARWIEMSARERIAGAFRFPERSRLRWLLPRLLGARMLTLLKGG